MKKINLKLTAKIVVVLLLFLLPLYFVFPLQASTNWTKIENGIDSAGFTSIVIDPSDPNNLYVVSYPIGVYASFNGGANWEKIYQKSVITPIPPSNQIGILYFPVNTITISPSNPQVLLLGSSSGIYKTEDRGKNWNFLGLDGRQITSIAIDPSNSNIIYAGTKGNGLYKSSDGGKTWDGILNSEEVRYVYSPEANTIYVACVDKGLLMSRNRGSDWLNLNSGLGNYSKNINVITVAKSNPKIVYLGCRGALFKSTDAGNNWTNLKSLPISYVNSISIDPTNPNVIYVGTTDGVYKSTDGGNNWENLGLKWQSVNALAVDYSSGIIYAGTDSSLYKLDPLDHIEINKIQDQVANKPFDIIITAKDSNNNVLAKFNGTISLSVDAGTITPSTIQMVNGTAIASVRINNVEGTVTIIAKELRSGKTCRSNPFKIFYYTIDAIAYAGGIISPHGSIPVEYGASKTFDIQPIDGYEIKEVKVDGLSVGNVSRYIFNGIDKDHRIEAFFKEKLKGTTIVLRIGTPSFAVNNALLPLDAPPIIKNGRTLVPIRAIVEALGGSVLWEPQEKKVSIALNTTVIELWIGKPTATVNGTTLQIDPNNSSVVPEIINGRTMLPLRFIAENLGCNVIWVKETQTIFITRAY